MAVTRAATATLAGCTKFDAQGGWIPEFDAFMQEAFALR